MRKALSLLLSLALVVTLAATSSAAPKQGGKCKKVGKVFISKNVELTCIRKGKSRVWSKEVRVRPVAALPRVAPSTSPTPSVSPSPVVSEATSSASSESAPVVVLPSPSPESSPSAAPSPQSSPLPTASPSPSVGDTSTNSSGAGTGSQPVVPPQSNPTTGTGGSTSTPSGSTVEQSDSSVFTLEEVARRNGSTECWTIIDGNVYDITNWISEHPGGREAILSLCGKDGSTMFRGQHGSQERPNAGLESWLIGRIIRT
jgi:predicted heme/steroid binding protein